MFKFELFGNDGIADSASLQGGPKEVGHGLVTIILSNLNRFIKKNSHGKFVVIFNR